MPDIALRADKCVIWRCSGTPAVGPYCTPCYDDMFTAGLRTSFSKAKPSSHLPARACTGIDGQKCARPFFAHYKEQPKCKTHYSTEWKRDHKDRVRKRDRDYRSKRRMKTRAEQARVSTAA